MILVTGSESFIGKKLIKKLQDKRINYLGVDLINIKKKNYVCADIRDKKISKYIPIKSTIVHLAAISKHSDFEKQKQNAIDINLGGTLNLLNIAEKKRCNQFIFASSEWVYGNMSKKIMKETDLININTLSSAYAKSKALGEVFLSMFDKIKNRTILRFGIIYSNRRSGGSAVESLFNECIKKNLINVHNKKNSRRFIHIDDIISGIMSSINLKGVNTINLAGKKDISMETIVKTSSKILNKTIKIKEKYTQNLSRRRPSILMAKKKLNWQPSISLNEGLKLMIKK